MSIITDFSQSVDGNESSDFLEKIPVHTLEALDHYFMKGWSPGGFLTALITENYIESLKSADYANRQRFWFIITWLVTFAPKGSIGSNRLMKDWIADKDSIRSAYVEQAEKNYEWRALSGKIEK